MAKRPIGPFTTAAGTVLACAGCGKQDAFEVRRASLLVGWFGGPIRDVRQVVCWACGHIHWFKG